MEILNLSAVDALQRRDALETAITNRLPQALQPYISEALTRVTGLAPSNTQGQPIWPGSVLRALIYLLSMLLASILAIVFTILMALPASLALVSAMRYFTSGLGHHLTHNPSVFPWPASWTRKAYDVLSGFLLLVDFETYRKEHGRQHAKVAGPDDPDQQFIEYLGARMSGWVPFLWTLISPSFHARFLLARLRASVGSGPIWRRLVATLTLVAIWKFPLLSLPMIFGYQAASLLSLVSLHLWTQRPESGSPNEIAKKVTFGRLLLPEANWIGFLKLPLYAIVNAVFLQGDLKQHLLHHLGKGPWTEAPYVYTRLLLEGQEVNQTASLRAMLRAGFQLKVKPTNYKPTDSDYLGM